MYGSFLSDGQAGHVHGTAAYDVTTTGEPAGWRLHILTALLYESGAQMQHLQSFALSEGDRDQDLLLASTDLEPKKTPDAIDDGLEGWSFMMRTADRVFALLYFEQDAARPTVSGLEPKSTYQWTWYDPPLDSPAFPPSRRLTLSTATAAAADTMDFVLAFVSKAMRVATRWFRPL